MGNDNYQWGQQNQIRCLRNYLGLSVNEAAAIMDTSVRSWQSFESGRHAIPDGVFDDLGILVDRLHNLADDYADRDKLDANDLTSFQLRAAGIACVQNPDLTIE